MMIEPSLEGVIIFETLLLLEITLVSVHYRKKYEELKYQRQIEFSINYSPLNDYKYLNSINLV